jgi:hypothetical protein
MERLQFLPRNQIKLAVSFAPFLFAKAGLDDMPAPSRDADSGIVNGGITWHVGLDHGSSRYAAIAAPLNFSIFRLASRQFRHSQRPTRHQKLPTTQARAINTKNPISVSIISSCLSVRSPAA